MRRLGRGVRRHTHHKKTASKNVHAVVLGRKGGVKGGPARAAKLTRERRKQIAAMGGYARGKGD